MRKGGGKAAAGPAAKYPFSLQIKIGPIEGYFSPTKLILAE